uniref:Protein kinase domain-containing protein n=1 Tax=Fagus sylvatica TaxID=28930 RepID=A0A2N9HYE5_FAGSY
MERYTVHIYCPVTLTERYVSYALSAIPSLSRSRSRTALAHLIISSMWSFLPSALQFIHFTINKIIGYRRFKRHTRRKKNRRNPLLMALHYVKGGCLYRGNMGRTAPPKFKGVQVFSYKELEVATSRFSEANIIGNGGYGVVYRGVLSDGTVAAIKMLHREGKQGERAFRVEVDLLSRLHSPYLVELLGYCADQQHRLLIFEFMSNGTLQHHLHPSHNQHRPLNWATRLNIALDCAKALEFLHENAISSPVIHRSFKCTNVLLDQNFHAKVSDFGLAKMGSDKINGQVSTRVLGTTGYLAPEYASTGKLTTKSDVYSYGVVLLELLTGRVPVDSKRPTGEHVLVSWALPRLTNREKLMEMVDPALQGQYSKKDLIQIAAIAAVCVQPEADYRPLMTDVVQSLIPLVRNLSSVSSSSSCRFLNQI